MSQTKPDIAVWGSLTVLLFVGLTAVYSATRDQAGMALAARQAVFMSVGIVLLIAMSRARYRWLADHAAWLYGVGIMLLASLLVIGKQVNGARSWIDLGPVNLQPSELTRLTTLLLMARVYELHEGDLSCSGWGTMLAVLGLPTLLVLMQPDLGMALVYTSLLGCLFVMARLPRGFCAAAVSLAVLGFVVLAGLHRYEPGLFFEVVRPHQWERLTSFWHPELDPLGSGYQYIQAKRMIGSGELTGTGELRVLPTSRGSLPESHTDFIFAVIGQQWGFVGTSLLVTLYYVLMYRLISWAMQTRDAFAAFFIAGMVTMWTFQIFVNVGMNIGLTPITGLTLPFVSYGGSSLVSNLTALGIMAGMRRPLPLLPASAERSDGNRGGMFRLLARGR